MLEKFLEKAYGFLNKIGSRFEPNPKVDSDVLEFHSDQVELEEQKLPLVLRSMLYVVLVIIITGTIWSVIAKVDKVVVAEGRLTSSAQTITLQPLENSIIKNFRVQVGDVVKKDQILVDLDPTFSKADAARLKQRGDMLTLQMQRLEAELAVDGNFEPERDLDPVEAQIQLNLYKGRRSEFKFRLAVYENTLNELKAAQASFESQLGESKKQLDILTRIEAIYKELYNKKHESLASYLNTQFQTAQKVADISRLSNDIDEKRQALLKVSADMSAFSSKWKNDILTELTTVRRDFDSVKEELSKASKMYELSYLTAPAPGVVLELGPFSVGSVARVGEPIMVLVPLDEPLEAEIVIDAANIGYVRNGDTVRLKLSTFPFQKHGTLSGEIRTIANDSTKVEEKEEPKYRARVKLTETNLRDVPDDYSLFPGMSLRAEVKVGTRRVITFFTYPLIRTFDQGLRDP